MLGLSGPGLRRLSLIYERVEGPLPRDDRGGRLWPAGALERLEAARLAEREGRAVSVEAALRGETIAGEALPRSDAGGRSGVDAAAVAGELRAMREALEEQNRVLGIMAGRLEALERENRELREAGPPVPGIGPAAADPAPPRGRRTPTRPPTGGRR